MINEMVTIELKATEYKRLIKQWVKQKNAIQRVRELHKGDPEFNWCISCGNDYYGDWQQVQYPCPTIKALDGEQ